MKPGKGVGGGPQLVSVTRYLVRYSVPLTWKSTNGTPFSAFLSFTKRNDTPRMIETCTSDLCAVMCGVFTKARVTLLFKTRAFCCIILKMCT